MGLGPGGKGGRVGHSFICCGWSSEDKKQLSPFARAYLLEKFAVTKNLSTRWEFNLSIPDRNIKLVIKGANP
jgi:hypothetical protein